MRKLIIAVVIVLIAITAQAAHVAPSIKPHLVTTSHRATQATLVHHVELQFTADQLQRLDRLSQEDRQDTETCIRLVMQLDRLGMRRGQLMDRLHSLFSSYRIVGESLLRQIQDIDRYMNELRAALENNTITVSGTTYTPQEIDRLSNRHLSMLNAYRQSKNALLNEIHSVDEEMEAIREAVHAFNDNIQNQALSFFS